jgi:sugar lactone lactonase YvrE
LDRAIALPASQITNVCFAGAGLERMFVTSAARAKPDEAEAGCLFEILEPGATGLPPGQFGG